MTTTSIRPPRRARLALAVLAATLASFVPVSLLVGTRPAAAEPGAGTANNPWPTSCDMRVGVVVDRSHSIRAAGEQNPGLVRDAVGDLAQRLSGTGAAMAVWSFSTLASGFTGPNPLGGTAVDAADYPSIGFTSLDTPAGTAAVRGTVDAIPFALPPADPTDPTRDRLGATNWEAGLGHGSHGIPGAVAPNGDRPRDADVLVFVTDGNPTIHNAQLAGLGAGTADDDVDAALVAAQEAKTVGAPTRVVAVGVGDVNVANLERVTGGYPAAQEGEDYWTTDFGGLGDALVDVATRICGGSLVIRKLVPGTQPGSWVPRPGWSFTADFPDGDPAFLEPGTALTTGADGTVTMSWLNPAGDTDVVVTEQLEPDQRLAGVTCSTPSGPEAGAAPVEVGGEATDDPWFGLTVPRHAETVCEVRNYRNGLPLQLEKEATPAELDGPGDVTFTLTLTNPDQVEPVRIDALLDDHYGDLFDRGNDHVRDNTCDDSEPGSRFMAPGATGTCSFVARVEPEPDGGPHHDVVTVHGREIRADGTEGDPVDVSADATVTFATPPAPDLVVTKDDGTDEVPPGGETTYELTVANRGGAEATGVYLADVLPDGMSVVSASDGATLDPDGDAARDGSPAVVWPWFGLAPGEERTVEVTVRVADQVVDGTELHNRAVVGDDGRHGPDANPADNAAVDVDTVVVPVLDEPPVTRPPDPSTGGVLPRTGGDVGELALWGAALAAAGGALVGLARRSPGGRLRLPVRLRPRT